MEKESLITMVFPANVEKAWPHVSPLLAPAVDRIGTHQVADVRKEILVGAAQLWVQWKEGCEAALVSEFKNFPQGLWLNIWLFGVRPDVQADEPEFERHIFEFARANHCTGITHTGRKGWERRHQHLRIKSESVVYNLLLSDIEAAEKEKAL